MILFAILFVSGKLRRLLVSLGIVICSWHRFQLGKSQNRDIEDFGKIGEIKVKFAGVALVVWYRSQSVL